MFYIGTGIRISDHDFANLAHKYRIEEAALRAVAEVEARNTGFTSANALVCLYEPHIAYRYTSGATRKALVKAGLAYQKWGTKPYPKSSYPRIDKCADIAGEEVACLATSWGMPQMMGFNHKVCGYKSALAMVKSFAVSEVNQIEAMIKFIRSNLKIHDALKAHDWMTFAHGYNGPSYATNNYHTKLANAYAKWVKKIAERPAPEAEVPAPEPKPEVPPVSAPSTVTHEPPSLWEEFINALKAFFSFFKKG